MRLLRTVVGLALLGAFIFAWLNLADSVATMTCDDGCSGNEGWSADPQAKQWTTQLWIARVGAACAALAGVLWCLRLRDFSLALAVAAVLLLCAWWPIAQEGRFGPPDISTVPGPDWA